MQHATFTSIHAHRAGLRFTVRRRSIFASIASDAARDVIGCAAVLHGCVLQV
jgi:hypothetical protein